MSELAKYIVEVRGDDIFKCGHSQDVLSLEDHHHYPLDHCLKGVIHALKARLDRVIEYRDLEAGDLDVPDLVLVTLCLRVNVKTERNPEVSVVTNYSNYSNCKDQLYLVFGQIGLFVTTSVLKLWSVTLNVLSPSLSTGT